MANLSTKSRTLWDQSRSVFSRLATGGDWAISQTVETRRNLIWFWFDGFFASASDNIVGTYLVIYILAMGATQGQIGLMSSLSSLMAAAVLLPGAMLVERIGRRRNLVLIGGGWARMALLLLALLPLVFGFNSSTSTLVYIAIALSVSRDTMSNLSYPAWMSLTGDIVPLEGRGRYFSSRNFIMGLTGIVTTFLAGLLITHSGQPAGYQIALFAAFAIGSLSVFSFAHLSEKQLPLAIPQVKQSMSLPALLRDLTSNREFLMFAATTALWNFSLNVAGPFFNVHLVKNLHADATMVGLTTIASSVATMLVQRKLGDLNDRWGAHKLTMISGLLIPVVPFLWVFATAGWHIIPINIISGALWGAYNMGSFNYLLMIIPADRRARYSALFQVTVMVSLAIGAAVGSLVVTTMGFNTVFIASAAGRLIAALLFARLLMKKRPAAAGGVEAEAEAKTAAV